MARGNNKMAIFLDERDYARFLEILSEVVPDFAIDCWVFCVMPNHYHLVLRTRCANLSLAIRHLNGTYAQWWNRRHGHVGHVFQGRFKAQVVETSVYLWRLCRYVLLNPVRAALCREPGGWPWSSFHALTGRTTSCVDIDSLLGMLDDGAGRDLHAALVDSIDRADDLEMTAFIRGDRRVIGTDGFAAQFRTRARAASKEVPARERRIGTPSLTEILAEAVREGAGLPGGIRRAHESAGYALSDIARCAGLSPKAVSRILRGHESRRPGTRLRPTLDLTPTSSDADRGST